MTIFYTIINDTIKSDRSLQFGGFLMKNSITFKKLIMLFFSVTVPLFLFCIFLLHWHNTVTRNRTFASIQEKTDQVSRTLADEINQIYNMTLEIANQAALRKLAAFYYPMDIYERGYHLLLIQEQQTSIANANKYIDNFIIYYPNRMQAFNSSNVTRGRFFSFTEEEYQELVNIQQNYDFLIPYRQGLSEVILPLTGPNFLIRVDLSSQTIHSLLESTFTEYENFFLLEAFDCSYQLTNLDTDQLNQLSTNQLQDTVSIDGRKYYHFSSAVPYGEMQLHFFFSTSQLFTNTAVYLYLYLFLGIFVLFACCFFLWGCHAIIRRPIFSLANAFQNINRQDYSVRILEKGNSDFSYLYKEFNQMAKQLGNLIEKDYQQQLLLNKAELKQLQAQINPHFLYNSFFLLQRMIYDEMYPEAQKMADTLGQYFQYITRNNQEYMSLKQEYHHAMLYCDIQKIRFENRIRVEADELPEKYSYIQVPKLILQPIIENAYNYGFKNKVENGLLRITIQDVDSNLIISIEDNGENLSDHQLNKIQDNLATVSRESSLLEMTGILNIQRRMHIYSDTPGQLIASRSSLGGLCIKLLLPIWQLQEHEEKP